MTVRKPASSLAVAIVSWGLCGLCGAVVGDEPAGPVVDDAVEVTVRGTDERQFPLITLDFEVKRPDGTTLLDATREDFTVTEDGSPVEVRSFQSPLSREFRPTTVVLVVDCSGSMREEDRMGGLKRAVASFLEKRPAGSQVTVVAFSSNIVQITPFTSESSTVQFAVNALQPDGATRFYDAVSEALALISDQPGRRAILALTDGQDTFSQFADLNTVTEAAQKIGVPVHTLGLGTEANIEADALRQLASETRGRYFPATDSDQLRSIFEEIARGLGENYTLSYETSRPIQDGTLRPIQVRYRASTRAGEAAIFIRGMVVPAGGWSPLFLALVVGLGALAWLPGARAWPAGRSS